MGKGGQKLQTSSDKMNKSWRCNIQHGNYSFNNTDSYIWKLPRELILKVLITRKKCNCVVIDVNSTYCANHFIISTCIKSLLYT